MIWFLLAYLMAACIAIARYPADVSDSSLDTPYSADYTVRSQSFLDLFLNCKLKMQGGHQICQVALYTFYRIKTWTASYCSSIFVMRRRVLQGTTRYL